MSSASVTLSWMSAGTVRRTSPGALRGTAAGRATAPSPVLSHAPNACSIAVRLRRVGRDVAYDDDRRKIGAERLRVVGAHVVERHALDRIRRWLAQFRIVGRQQFAR
jgi:hypothetical protein